MNDLTKKLFEFIDSGRTQNYQVLFMAAKVLAQSKDHNLLSLAIQFNQIDSFNNFTGTPLSYAAHKGNIDWLKILLPRSNHACIQLAFWEAAGTNRKEVMAYIIGQYDMAIDFNIIEINFKTSHVTPFQNALKKGQAESLTFLIIHGAKPNQTDMAIAKQFDLNMNIPHGLQRQCAVRRYHIHQTNSLQEESEKKASIYQVTKWGYCLAQAEAKFQENRFSAAKYLVKALNKKPETTLDWLSQLAEKTTLNSQHINNNFIKYAAKTIKNLIDGNAKLEKQFHDAVTLKLFTHNPPDSKFFGNQEDKNNFFNAKSWTEFDEANINSTNYEFKK